MTIWLSDRYVVLKCQYTLKRSSLFQESSFSYFFFFSVGWLCLAKLDESSKFGCFLPALLLLPFPICNAPPLTLTIPNKKILLHPREFFIGLLLIMPNCARSTSNTSSHTILDTVDHELVMYNMYHSLFFMTFYDLGLDNE